MPSLTYEEDNRLSVMQVRGERGVTEPDPEAHIAMVDILIEGTTDEFSMPTMNAYKAARLVIDMLKAGGL